MGPITSNRWLIVAAAAVLLIVAASIVIGMLNDSEREFAPDAPESAVQRYVRALEEEDATAIRALMAPEVLQRCDLTDIRNALRYSGDRDLRVTLRKTEVTGDRAEVRVNISESSGDPFGSSFDHDETFDLVRVSGAWLFAEAGWPVYCVSKARPL